MFFLCDFIFFFFLLFQSPHSIVSLKNIHYYFEEKKKLAEFVLPCWKKRLIRWVRNLGFVHVPRELSLNPSSSTQPKIPFLFAVKQSTLVMILHHFWQYTCLPSCPVTFFRHTIHGLHAAFNVVGDVAVEQPATRVLRTHFHCLQKLSGEL